MLQNKASKLPLSAGEERELVENWVKNAPERCRYMLDFFNRGAELCQISDDTLVLLNEQYRICYASGPSAQCSQLYNTGLVMTDDQALANRLVEEGVYPEIMECITAFYLKPIPPQISHPNIKMRPLTETDLPFVLENYHNPGSLEVHIRDRIAEGMVGGVIDGQLAGFAGIHQEGAMGLLEVLPEFRRRGLAELLEAELIKSCLKKGQLPYCHIRKGNTASIALQEKLGLSIDTHPVYWVG